MPKRRKPSSKPLWTLVRVRLGVACPALASSYAMLRLVLLPTTPSRSLETQLAACPALNTRRTQAYGTHTKSAPTCRRCSTWPTAHGGDASRQRLRTHRPGRCAAAVHVLVLNGAQVGWPRLVSAFGKVRSARRRDSTSRCTTSCQAMYWVKLSSLEVLPSRKLGHLATSLMHRAQYRVRRCLVSSMWGVQQNSALRRTPRIGTARAHRPPAGRMPCTVHCKSRQLWRQQSTDQRSAPETYRRHDPSQCQWPRGTFARGDLRMVQNSLGSAQWCSQSKPRAGAPDSQVAGRQWAALEAECALAAVRVE